MPITRTNGNSIRKRLLYVGFILSPFLMGVYRIVGYLGLLLILLGVFINIKTIRLTSISFWALASIILIVTRVIIQSFTNNLYASTFHSALLQILTYLFIIGISNTNNSLEDWKWILDRASAVYLIWGLYLFVTKQLDESMLFGTMYGNVLIVTFGVFLLDIFTDSNKVIRICECALALLFLYYTNMRSALFGALIAIMYVLLPIKMINNKKFNTTIFIALVLVCFTVPYVYMELYSPSSSFTMRLSNYLQLSSRQLTGSRFFSGRHIIWPNVLHVISEVPIFGGGVGFNPSEIYDTTQSAHNLFLFLRLEQGLVGLCCFVLLIKSIWNDYNNRLSGSIKVSVQAIFVALMIQQTFSLGLLGGKGTFSFFSWAVLISYTKETINSENETLVSKRK